MVFFSHLGFWSGSLFLIAPFPDLCLLVLFHDSRRAQIKSKLLTGTYILQGNRAALNQYQVNLTCKLCSAAPETRQHFISECDFLEKERTDYIEKLQKLPVLINIPSAQVQNPEFLTQLLLDASAVLDIEQCEKDIWGLLELQTREYISKIHHKKVQVGKDQEKAQSEKDSHSKNRGGKKPN